MFGDEFEKKVDAMVARYPEPKAALLPLLWLVQRTQGWVSLESEEWVARRLGVTPAHVHGTVTFYTMYKQDYMHSLEGLCKDGYVKIYELIPVPEDFICYDPPGKFVTDPSPFNHSTKIAVLEVKRK